MIDIATLSNPVARMRQSRAGATGRRGVRVTTLLISHDDGLGHDMGHGHPERPDRLRALMRRLDDQAFIDLVRLEAPVGEPHSGHARACRPLFRCSGGCGACAWLPGPSRCRHRHERRNLGRRDPGRRWCGPGRRPDRRPAGRQCVRGHCARPATTPRPLTRWASAFSTMPPLRRATRGWSTGLEAHRHRRLRRPPWQRHAGNLLGRSERTLLLHPRDAAVPRHRGTGANAAPMTRSSTCRCGPATTATSSAPRMEGTILPARRGFRAGPRDRFGRLRRPPSRPPRQPRPGRGGFRLGDRPSSGRRRPHCGRPLGVAPRRRVRSRGFGRVGRPRM